MAPGFYYWDCWGFNEAFLYLNPYLLASGILVLILGVLALAWSFKAFPPKSILTSTAYTILWLLERGKLPQLTAAPNSLRILRPRKAPNMLIRALNLKLNHLKLNT